MKNIDDTYNFLLKQSFALDPAPTTLDVRSYGKQHHDRIALQEKTIALTKKQMSGDTADTFDDNGDGTHTFGGDDVAFRPAEPELVPLP